MFGPHLPLRLRLENKFLMLRLGASPMNEAEFSTPTIIQDDQDIKKCEVNINDAIFPLEDPSSPQSFVSIILFLASGLIASSIRLHLPTQQNALSYAYADHWRYLTVNVSVDHEKLHHQV